MAILTKGIVTTSTSDGAEAFSLTSTEEEPKKAVKVHVSSVITKQMLLTVYLEREKIVDSVPIDILGLVNQGYDIPMNIDIPPGQTLTGYLKFGASAAAGVFGGWIEYEIL